MTTAEAIEYFEKRIVLCAAINLHGQQACQKALDALRLVQKTEEMKSLVISANGIRLEEKQATSDEKQATSDWISVEEMLPVPYVDVLVIRKSLFSGGRLVGVDHITSLHREVKTWGHDHKDWKTKVTHWMTLPAPPKEE